MALFAMEHYEVIIVSWLAAASALAVVSAFAFALAFWVFGEKRAKAAPRAAAAPAGTPVVAEPARPRPVMAAVGTPVGAV